MDKSRFWVTPSEVIREKTHILENAKRETREPMTIACPKPYPLYGAYSFDCAVAPGTSGMGGWRMSSAGFGMFSSTGGC